jgi:hypothetical protein
MTPLVWPVSGTLCPSDVSNGRIVPRMLNCGISSVALLILTSSWSAAPAGSYLTSMPSAVSLATFGISASSELMRSPNLPGALTRKLPLSSPSASTCRSNVPRTPIRSTVTPLEPCWVVGVVVPPLFGAAALLKPRLARSTPIAIVRTSMPSLKPTSAMPIRGPSSVSGPIESGAVVGAAPGAVGDSVNVWRTPAAFLVAGVVPLEAGVSPAAGVAFADVAK